MRIPVEYRQYDRDNGQAGMIAPSCYGLFGVAAGAPTASRAYLLRFVPTRDMVITKIAFVVTTAAGSDDAVDVGIYTPNSDATTYDRLVSLGATTGLLNSTGVKAPTIATTTIRARNVYYAAIAPGTFGGTACQLWSATFTGLSAEVFGTTPGLRETAQLATSHPLPSSITPSASSTQPPILIVRES